MLDVAAPEVLGWEELEAMFGPVVVADLVGPDPFDSVRLPEPDPLEEIARCERAVAMLQGEQLAAMATFVHAETGGCAPGREADGARDSAFAQIALRLGVAHRTADSRVGDALGLAQRLPATLRALCAGELTLPKARAILEETDGLDIAQCANLEPELVAMAGGRTPGGLRRMVRARVEQVDAEAVTKRTERARGERRVELSPEPDGMYALWALLPAEQAIAAFGVIDTLAHANRAPGAELGIDALRADALVDLILNPGGQSRVKYEMRVLVPFGTVLGTEDTPGHVPGQGPIPADVCRTLAADSTWRRLLTDPGNGTALDLGADRYTPSDRLAEFVHTRDQNCRFPGCRRRAERCDLDHTIAFVIGGRTIRINLSALCRRHHRVKHLPGWTCTQDPDGTLTFSTPHGRVYRTRPPTATGTEPPVETVPPGTVPPSWDERIPF